MWKNKLEDTSELSFATLQNKDAAWEKLQSRFENKSKKKNIAWYWIAAACILIAVSIPLFTTHRTNDVAQHTSSNNNHKKFFAKKDEAVKNIVPGILIINQTKKQLQQNNIVNIHKQKIVVIDSVNNIAFINNNQQSLHENIVSPVMNDTNTIAVISPTVTQKKLKVVHVNELGEPVEFPVDIVHTTNLHLFQLKLAQQEIYNAASTAANNNSGFSFKPKKLSN